MKALHLFSNAKWTGPAEPVLHLVHALRQAGVEVDYACTPRTKAGHNRVAEEARARGIEPMMTMHLRKHRNPWFNMRDRHTLRGLLAERRYDLVHCHLDNDHLIAAGPAAQAGIPLVRSSYHGMGLPALPSYRRMISATRLVFEPSERAALADHHQLGLDEARYVIVDTAIDLQRFDPARPLPDGRARFGLGPDTFVFGIVARMQTHRRYEDLFEAFARLAPAAPHAHLIVVGRGTRQAEVGYAPVKRHRLEGRVHFTGYLSDDDYVGMLNAFDAGIFLVPGSDGTCRAAREIMAMGKPVIAADRGMLREIVSDHHDGLIAGHRADTLFTAMARLVQAPARTRELGAQARSTAEQRFAPERVAERCIEHYQAILRA